MIKPVVGKVKSPAYALPENDHVYGIESKLDKEGAGEVVTSWATSKPSEPPCSQKSFPATNREALKNGCLTSKAQREYGKQFPVMKQNPKHQSNKSQKSNARDDAEQKAEIGEVITSIYQESAAHQPPQAFGIQTKKNKVGMTELLRWTELDAETDYPDLSNKKRKVRFLILDHMHVVVLSAQK